jgi:hypothetical protein
VTFEEESPAVVGLDTVGVCESPHVVRSPTASSQHEQSMDSNIEVGIKRRYV